jgi:hypothetical protein
MHREPPPAELSAARLSLADDRRFVTEADPPWIAGAENPIQSQRNKPMNSQHKEENR